MRYEKNRTTDCLPTGERSSTRAGFDTYQIAEPEEPTSNEIFYGVVSSLPDLKNFVVATRDVQAFGRDGRALFTPYMVGCSVSIYG